MCPRLPFAPAITSSKGYGIPYPAYQPHLLRRNGVIVAWHALPGTQTALSKSRPLNEGNLVAMELTAAGGPGGGARGGIVNDGYWGISLARGERYSLALFIRNPQVGPLPVRVALASADLRTTYAECNLSAAGGGAWAQHSAQLLSSGTDADARLVVTFPAPATLVVDSVSLFPSANADKGAALGHVNPWPFRPDLLAMLKALRPAFVRLPGGCYVEGDWMRNAFRWKPALGPNEGRPGHMNGVWGCAVSPPSGTVVLCMLRPSARPCSVILPLPLLPLDFCRYWSTDGLGLFEYMVLAEELKAEPVWVVNNGVAHGDSECSRLAAWKKERYWRGAFGGRCAMGCRCRSACVRASGKRAARVLRCRLMGCPLCCDVLCRRAGGRRHGAGPRRSGLDRVCDGGGQQHLGQGAGRDGPPRALGAQLRGHRQRGLRQALVRAANVANVALRPLCLHLAWTPAAPTAVWCLC